MPRFDGTGPLGQDPMTGGGRGYCIERIGKDPSEKHTYSFQAI